MKRLEGIHFYINVENLNEVILDEEKKTNKVNHSVHAIDTYFSSIEHFGKTHFPETFVIEKITGSRLHMYVTDSIKNAYEVVAKVVGFAGKLAEFVNRDIPKYKTILSFKIQAGACYGRFYNFKFEREDADEETTVGYAANVGAKLQSVASIGGFAISSKIYESLDDNDKKSFIKKHSKKIEKYGETCYYEQQINELNISTDLEADLEYSKSYANQLNLTEMEFRTANKEINLASLSRKECKKLVGIPLFSDGRGFTSQFDKEDVNLTEMASKTQKILTSMYEVIDSEKGHHIQFQGDREFALFHDYPGYECTLNAVKAGLKMIDRVKEYSVSVGVGQSLGTMFAAKIGTRGEKDTILVGSTVIEADRSEDECAQENQLVISNEIFQKLKDSKPTWASHFKKSDGYYYTSIGFKELINKASTAQLHENNNKKNYNGAWGI